MPLRRGEHREQSGPYGVVIWKAREEIDRGVKDLARLWSSPPSWLRAGNRRWKSGRAVAR